MKVSGSQNLLKISTKYIWQKTVGSQHTKGKKKKEKVFCDF